MNYTDNILKITYTKKDGRDVIDSGSVVIKGVEHRVNHGWVYCNLSLQGESWSTTRKESICPKCFPDKTTYQNKTMKVEQLKLF